MSLQATTNSMKDILTKEITDATKVSPSWTDNPTGNLFGWLRLFGPDELLPAAQVMAAHKARLCTITAYAEERGDQDKKRGIAYHFALGNTLFTITIPIYDPESLEKLPVPSITPLFRNADWNEREFREMFNIEIEGHPNPKRLFLDERLDAGIMTKLIPFSAMLHGAGSKDLWEKVMAEKTGYDPAGSEAAVAQPEAITEPEFTPVEDGVKDPGSASTPAQPAACGVPASNKASAPTEGNTAPADADSSSAPTGAAPGSDPEAKE